MCYHKIGKPASRPAVRYLDPGGDRFGSTRFRFQESEVRGKCNPSVGVCGSEIEVGNDLIPLMNRINRKMKGSGDRFVIRSRDITAFRDFDPRHLAAGSEWREKKQPREDGGG